MDLPTLYVATMEGVLSLLSLSHELGHLACGLLIYLTVLGFFGPRRGGFAALVAVSVAECLNEAIQAAHYGSWRIADTLGDVGWTVALPFALFLYTALMSAQAPMTRRVPAYDRRGLFPF